MTETSISAAADRQKPTSASEVRSCNWCSRDVKGRRRNGFCSDRCRLRASRAWKQERIEEVLASIERRVDELAVEVRSEVKFLRAELVGGDQEQGDER